MGERRELFVSEQTPFARWRHDLSRRNRKREESWGLGERAERLHWGRSQSGESRKRRHEMRRNVLLTDEICGVVIEKELCRSSFVVS